MKRLFATALFALSAAACSDSTEPAGLRLTMSIDRNQVARNDSVEVTLTATNMTGKTLTVVAPESYGVCMRAFRVFDVAQREVNVETFLCALLQLIAPLPIELAPGASVTARDYWEPATSTLDGQALPAGTYRLVGHYHVEQAVVSSGPESITLVP